MQQTQTCRQQLTQDSYQFCPSAQLGREAAGWLVWASFWTEPCCRSGKARPGFRCFKYLVCHPALLSLSTSAAFSGSLGCHHSPFILQMYSSPQDTKGQKLQGQLQADFPPGSGESTESETGTGMCWRHLQIFMLMSLKRAWKTTFFNL